MTRDVIDTYEKAVEYLYQVPRFTIKSSMEDTKAFLKKMGNPDSKMKIIHIAGTNGKGSVCAYLRSILMETGASVGTFTSPHLVEMNERIQINGRNVEKTELLNAFNHIYGMLEDGYHPTFFEFLFFICMHIFENKKPDYVILETGLGGRLDATNSIGTALLSIITEIGMDHMEYLGDTLEAIAGEKAGIIKENIPVVYIANVEKVAKVIENRAKEKKSQLFPLSKQEYRLLNFKNKNIDFSYVSRYYDYIELTLGTTALYQIENASLAVRAAEVLLEKEKLSLEAIVDGVYHAHWEGRMEEVLPEVYVDGAHNEDGVRAFVESVSRDNCIGRRYLVFSVVRDKFYDRMIQILTDSKLFGEMEVTTLHNNRALSIEELKTIFHKYASAKAKFYESVSEAYRAAADKKQLQDKIYVVGSLYLVGEFKGMLRSKSDD